MIIPSDIVIRAARNGKQTVWVSERLLVSLCDGLNSDYLRKKARYMYLKTVPAHRREQSIMPDTEAPWRYGTIDGNVYYDLNRIPDTEPTLYRTKIGDKDILLAEWEKSKDKDRTSGLEDVIKDALSTDWKGFMPAYAGLDKVKVEMLSRAASVFQASLDYAVKSGLDLRRFEFFCDLGAIIDRNQISYLPSNPRRLKDKAVRVLGGELVTEVITLPRAGNSNAVKWDDPQILSWLIVMRNSGMNTTNTHIARKIATICALCEKNTPSSSWIEHKLSDTKIKQLTYTRYGAGGRKAMPYKAYVPLAGAVFAGDCWMMDATRVNFIEFTQDGNKWAHIMVCMVYDVHSGAIVGRSYGLSENRFMYVDALQSAAIKCGYLPYELVIDRFPGHNTPEWEGLVTKIQRATGTRVEVTHKMQGKARLERAIDTVQIIAMQDSDKYYGQGIQSGRDYAHRSEECLAGMRKRAKAEGWNMDRAIDESEKAFKKYNESKYSEYSRAKRLIDESPMGLHDGSEKPHTYKSSAMELLQFFGLSKPIKLRAQGMIVTDINKVRYTYVINAAHYDTVKAHAEVTMYYDLEDLSRVELFTAAANPGDEKYLCEAIEQKSVQWSGPDKDVEGMGKATKRIREWEAAQKAELDQHYENAEFSELALLGMTADKDTKEAAETALYVTRAKERRKPLNKDIEETLEEVPVRLSSNDIRGLY